MYSKEELGRVKIWCHSLNNVIQYINISRKYSNPGDWHTGDTRMVYISVLSSAVINWGQVFSIGYEEAGYTAKNNSYKNNAFLKQIITNCNKLNINDFEQFNEDVMSIRDGHIAHIDRKTVKVGHGLTGQPDYPMITMTDPEQGVLNFDYDKLLYYALILHKEFQNIIINELTPPGAI